MGAIAAAPTTYVHSIPPETRPFTLDPDFLARYAAIAPPFGFEGLGELVYLRTYSRLKDDGTNEVWWETVRRVVEGTYNMQRRWITAMHLGWSDRKAQRSAQEMFDRMFHMKFLPPGRGLWAMGSPLTEERGLFAALNNCAFVSTETLADDLAEPFTFLMDASMLGIGVGFDTTGAGAVMVHACTGGTDTYPIGDTRESWVKSVGMLINSYLQPERGERIVFNYSAIRAAGEPIKGFGGVAAGAKPLAELHQAIRDVLDPLAGQLITARAIVDIMNLIGKCVVAGNVRRTAEIAFGDADSDEFINLKNYDLNPERADYGWTSNNSVFATVGMDYTKIATRVADNGEPGFAWLSNMQQFSRMDGRIDNKDQSARGGNPCLEQTLESYELCCLVETFPARHDSLEDYKRTLKFAYLYAKTVTLGNTPWEKTNRVLLRNRRIGCSQSGIVQAIAKLGIEEYRRWCTEGYNTIQYYDNVYSRWFVIPHSIKTTSVKPSGTVSLLAGATPGMHHPTFTTYIRRMRIARSSELVAAFQNAGYHVEGCIGDPSSVVVEIPVRITEPIRSESQVSMWEQLALAAFLQRNWADNQVSCTISFDQTTEGSQIAHALAYYQYQLKGISFLPRKTTGQPYPQMPYEAISNERYEQLRNRIRPLQLRQTYEIAEQERFCNNDTCVLL